MQFSLIIRSRLKTKITSKKMMKCSFFNQLFLVMSLLIIGSYQDEVKLTKDLKFKLRSGDYIPMIGLGTGGIRGTHVKETLDLALAAGYREIDSAAMYRNEEDFGKALKELLPKYNLTRQDVFITTKLSSHDLGEKAYAALQKSLNNLDCSYIDLYLIHWPGIFGATNVSKEEAVRKRDLSWQHLVKGVRNGLTRNIGVSNYNVRHLRDLLANDHGIKPAVNQVEWHPHYHQSELLELCQEEGILLQAYSSLGGNNVNELVGDSRITEIAKKLGKSPAQVLLRWALQQNIAIIPKARSKQHIEENIDLNFVIPEEDMGILNSFSQKKYRGNPDTIP